MRFSDLNPFIRFVSVRSLTGSYRNAVTAYDHRLFYILKGSLRIEIGDEKYLLTEDSFLLIPPALPYHVSVTGENRFAILNFDMTHENPIPEAHDPAYGNGFDPSLVFSSDAPEELSGVIYAEPGLSLSHGIEHLADIFFSKPPYWREEAGTLLKRIFILYVRRRAESIRPIPPILTEVLKFLHERYREPLTNESLAAHFGYHPNYLGRLFRKHMGMCLHKYLLSFRLGIARELLVSTDNSVETIALSVGFESPSYFSRYFKQVYSLSPLAYRNENRSAYL